MNQKKLNCNYLKYIFIYEIKENYIKEHLNLCHFIFCPVKFTTNLFNWVMILKISFQLSSN